MSARMIVTTNPTTKRIESVEFKGKMKVLYAYDENGFIAQRIFTGSKSSIPSQTELLKMAEAQHLDHINRIELISLIETIDTINTINTINSANIKIISQGTSSSASGSKFVQQNIEKEILKITDCGVTQRMVFLTEIDTIRIRIYVDGVALTGANEAYLVGEFLSAAMLADLSYTPNSPQFQLLKHTGSYNWFSCTLPISFTSELKICAYQVDSAVEKMANAYLTYDKRVAP